MSATERSEAGAPAGATRPGILDAEDRTALTIVLAVALLVVVGAGVLGLAWRVFVWSSGLGG